MASMDAFNSSVFETRSLTGVVNKMDYLPSTIGGMNIFETMPVRNKRIFVDRTDSTLKLIPTGARGAPPKELERDNRDAVPLETVALSKGFTIYADEVQDIRATGSETELMAVQAEYLRRMARVRDDMELTHEMHRLGALQGKLLDADGTTVIYDYFTEFGEAESTAVAFALGTEGTDVRQKCTDLIRSMARSSRGAFTMQTQVHALVGDSFFDKLVSHKSVKETYLNWQAAADLRDNKAFGDFTYGGIVWHNYRGTDDASTVAIATGEARFFPVGARGIFKKAQAPHPSMQYVNTAGQDVYAVNLRDKDRDFWVRGELYSYPLYFCQQPRTLRKGTTN